MATVAEVRAARKKRKAEEAKADAEAQAKIDKIRNRNKKPTKKEESFLDKFKRKAGKNRIDSALDAIESGIDDADEDSKRKK